jgi:hypothetical protein
VGRGARRRRDRNKRRKSPQGYEDNASLDKFCKIKANKEEKHKKSATNGHKRLRDGNWGEEKHKMGRRRQQRGKDCMTSGRPKFDTAHDYGMRVAAAFPPPRTSFNVSRGNQNYPNWSPISAVGRFVSLEPERWTAGGSLQDGALALLAGLALADLQEGSTSSGLEDLTDTLVGTGRALKVLVSTNLLADLLTLLEKNGLVSELSPRRTLIL